MTRILITAGPTREPIDPVRFLSNRSSGKMGYAIATAAASAKHEVTLISGPVNLSSPENCRRVNVTTAEEMCQTVLNELPKHDILIMTAAVADYTPVQVAGQKMKKQDGDLTIQLKRTKDILAEVSKIKQPEQKIIGFAAETQDLEKYAVDKMKRKKLDWIVANDVSRSDAGFGVDTNKVIIYGKDGQKADLPLMSKAKVAEKLIELVTK